MDKEDRLILENFVAKSVGKAVSDWIKKNGITDDVFISAMVSKPTLYIDETGVSHTGPLITVEVSFEDSEDDDDY